ncbi:Protein ERGIC-53 [Phlyctochytrium planicorne]|nr:Protein ERGIC-53 [Phlyctochytrium planicorne]
MLLVWVLLLVAGVLASNEPLKVEHHEIARRYDYRQSIKRPYAFFHQIPYFDILGNTITSPDYIRLTSSVPRTQGSVWAKDANPHKAWQLHFSVAVNGRSYVGEQGIAIWYTEDRAFEGPVYGSKDHFRGLGIFLDTSDSSMNRVTPYVHAHLNDGSVEMRTSKDYMSNSLGGCFRDFRNAPKPVWGRITYANRTLRVDLDLTQDGYGFTECFTFSGIDLPTGYYFGVTASTGDYIADDHDLYSFEAFEVDPKPKKSARRTQLLDEAQRKKIEEIKKRVDEANREENGFGELGSQEVFNFKVLNDLLEGQFKIIENLNLLHGKAGLAPIAASGFAERAKQHAQDAVISVDATVDALNRKVEEVSQEVKSLGDNIQELFLSLRDFTTQVGC